MDGRSRLSELLRKISVAFYTMDHLEWNLAEESTPETPEGYHSVAEARKIFAKCSRALVESLIESGKTDDEIYNYMMWFHGVEWGEFRSTGLPFLAYGNILRLLFPTRDELSKFYNTRAEALLAKNTLVTRLAMDGQWAVDIVPNGAEVPETTL
jgi:hypothetical protein